MDQKLRLLWKKETIAFVLLFTLCLWNYKYTDALDQDPYLITDYSRLHPVKVEKVVAGKEKEQLIQLIKEAKRKHLTISIAGQRHSQGGHTYYKDGIVIDMTSYNKILAFDPAKKKITVQAGATWKEIQEKINPYHLSIKTMQSQNIFTVGGSISINAHGRDIRNGSMIKSVESFRLLTAEGKIIQVSRTENADLFPLVLGGFGLYGVILDVTLTLTDDELYRMTTGSVSVDHYTDYFLQQVKGNPKMRMHIARISIAPSNFLQDMYVLNYKQEKSVPFTKYNQLEEREKWIIPSKIGFQINRNFDWGKEVFWKLQRKFIFSQNNKLISRNNVMRSESEFMEYKGIGENDLLQEYFIPVHQFAPFVADMRKVLKGSNVNLLNITVRYVNKDQEATLSYANSDMFALVCLFHVSLDDKGQKAFRGHIQQIIDVAEKYHGTYYLPYAPYPTVKQYQRAYPNYQRFYQKKNQYDPDHLFMNYFYQQYVKESGS
ncbi:FAD-binding oxidoreductase [Shimazuella sp. AN120528]|uniref:FAD-binding oxidoreductase n=1 Tax=Shimazuella soli TaxID=1892854 RepID=UPI001F114D92|nr:FAD-binding oxidoreductase [Shimazuella soli]MCH5585812.1 FAD-binding oxidoreductase [Shimazuella soli]